MTHKTKKHNAVINITSPDPKDSLEHIMNLPSNEREWAIKYYFANFQLGLYKFRETLEKLSNTIWQSQMQIPPATRERGSKLRELLLRGKSIPQISQIINLSIRQVKNDMNYLGIRLRKKRKKTHKK